MEYSFLGDENQGILETALGKLKMIVHTPSKENRLDIVLQTNAADTQTVNMMRVVLAVSVLLAVFIDSSSLNALNGFTWLIFFGFLTHSIVIYIYSQFNKLFSQSTLVHRVDVLWFSLIVIGTGRVNSFFYLLFFFAILTSSFRWGFEEGIKVTTASVVLFVVPTLVLDIQNDFSVLLLRTAFLLVVGYISVYWGESKVRLVHQLAVLRDVSRLSNPRFGVDHTITNVLEQTRNFFKAESCILVMKDKESGTYSLRTVKNGNRTPSFSAEQVSAEATLPLMAFSQEHIIAYTCPLRPISSSFFKVSLAYDCNTDRWKKQQRTSSRNLAEILEAFSFISAPLSLKLQQGRIYIASSDRSFSKADALFLNHITAQAFPVVENIELLDKMASEAAVQERHKISLDIHDITIQPYIGLKLGLGALKNKASPDNPLIEDINNLTLMTEKVISDLRQFAVNFKNSRVKSQSIFLLALNQQTEQIKDFYGVEINITIAGELKVSDRLATEVLQLIREGLSNICKHTLAKKGFVKIQCSNNSLKIQIENENNCETIYPIVFTPRSMSERTDMLGGKLNVDQGWGKDTVVNIEIPI